MQSEESYMNILVTQCVPILMYDASIWNSAWESLCRISVSFNNVIRKKVH